MSVDASVERRTEPENRNGDGNGVVAPSSTHRLRLNPNTDHEPDNYEDLQLEFSPLLFSSLEQYLPPFMLNARRDVKVQYMRDILLRYSNEAERNRVSVLMEFFFLKTNGGFEFCLVIVRGNVFV